MELFTKKKNHINALNTIQPHKYQLYYCHVQYNVAYCYDRIERIVLLLKIDAWPRDIIIDRNLFRFLPRSIDLYIAICESKNDGCTSEYRPAVFRFSRVFDYFQPRVTSIVLLAIPPRTFSANRPELVIISRSLFTAARR